jgi:hypothetical protein
VEAEAEAEAEAEGTRAAVAAVRISAVVVEHTSAEGVGHISAEAGRTLRHTQRRTFQDGLAAVSPVSHMPAHLFARLTLRIRGRHSMQQFTVRQRTLRLSVM